MDPFGRALLDYHRGETDAVVIFRTEDGVAHDQPIARYFWDDEDTPEVERVALAACRAPVLDVGAGAGRHSLHLQRQGLSVTAIDVSPLAVEVMAARGVRDVRCADVFTFHGGPFATVLLLGGGLGMAGTLVGLDRLFAHARTLLVPGGRILGDSADPGPSTEPSAGAGSEEVTFRLEHKDLVGPWTRWVNLDPVILAARAAAAGFRCEVLHNEGVGGRYMALLERDD